MKNREKRIILSIETSCDETAVAILECSGEVEQPTFKILGNALFSQTDIHTGYGGVFPTLAKREHAKNLVPLLKKALIEANLESSTETSTSVATDAIQKLLEREPSLYEQYIDYISSIGIPDIDAIAVTTGPGLEPALWVGINFAQALAHTWEKPLIPINHMEGHIVSVLQSRDTIQFPALALLISGAHTELVLINDWFKYEILGQTRDDAVGEAFDKTARLLGLPYPGGPEISRLAQEAREKELDSIKLPRPMIHSGDFDFSFSGLKTAVLYLVRGLEELSEDQKCDIAREFEDSVTDIFISKTKKALELHNIHTLIIGGGVIANTHLRHAFENLMNSHTGSLHIPTHQLSTDNAVMIGMAGYMRLLTGKDYEQKTPLKAEGKLSLEE